MTTALRIRARQLVEALPASIRVGPFDFQLVQWDALEAHASRRWGEFSAMEQLIRIQQEMPTPIKAADTLIHEVNHAAFWAYGIDDADREERTVAHLATAWTQIYRDNPWLFDWLRQALLPADAHE